MVEVLKGVVPMLEAEGTALEQLMAQRDAIIFGEHVKRMPRQDHEACAVVRVVRKHDLPVRVILGSDATWLMLRARAKLYSELGLTAEGMGLEGGGMGSWNDAKGTTAQQVLNVLDEAIRMAKREEDEGVQG